MANKGQLVAGWSEMETECKGENRYDGVDSGCDLDKGSTSDDSSSGWQRRVKETEKLADLDGEATALTNCSYSSRNLTIDGTSCIYKPTQEKSEFKTSESSSALVTTDGSFIQQSLDETILFEITKKRSCADYQPPPDRIFIENQKQSRARLLPQVLASLALAIAAMIEGYSAGYTSPALASMTSSNSTIPVNDQQVIINSIYI